MSVPARRALLVGLLCLLTCPARSASALDVSIKLEPGVAIPLSAPQTDHFGVGGGGFGRLAFTLTSFLDLQIGGGGFAFPSKDPSAEPVVIGAAAAGLRLQLPHQGRNGPRRFSPWIDANVLYARTGVLDRLGFDAGVGIGLSPGKARAVWLGVFARYLQVVQPSNVGFDNADAKLFLAGVYGEFHLVARDSDRDGVADSRDACPELFGPPDNRGCPWGDRDRDQVTDNLDHCVDVPGPADNGGCPWLDSDGDGVMDREDRCPRVAGAAGNAGCPWPDADHDGIADQDDKCPGVAGPADNGGCPWIDGDGDGVLDKNDRCPTIMGPADNGGCPRYTRVTVTDSKIEILEKIFFAFGKSEILPRSYPLLDEVVKALVDHSVLAVRIEGHTDARGSRRHNQKLSEGRAGAVMKYLIMAGIRSTRLEARGFGPTAPLDTNATSAGRERNRRVEFVIVKGPQ